MKKSMSKVFAVAAIATLLTSCVSTKRIGQVNMISTRNIDPHANYETVQKNFEYTRKELKRLRSESLQEAVDNAVKQVAKGEYLMNARVFIITHTGLFSSQSFFYVEGDIMGNPVQVAPVK